MENLKINFLGKTYKNPIIPASGTFGFGYEFAEFYDINILGSISIKGTTLEPRYGNKLPRIAECPSGLINSIGLQNPGVKKVVEEELVKLDEVYDDLIIANVGGHSIYEYTETVKKFNESNKVAAIELNISCPNVTGGGMAFGVQAASAAEVVSAVRKAYPKTLIVKLSPNVTDVTEIARAVEGAGADSVSLINTLLGMAIDSEKRRPLLSTITGGMSGPAVKPIALRMVWQVAKAVKIPVVGIGGITTGADAIEFLLAGASAIEVGTANFMNPAVTGEIVDYIQDYLVRHKMNSVQELIGALEI